MSSACSVDIRYLLQYSPYKPSFKGTVTVSSSSSSSSSSSYYQSGTSYQYSSSSGNSMSGGGCKSYEWNNNSVSRESIVGAR